ncbi:MAG: hypothetical protein Q8K60_02025, partial [Parachlamydiaceae bacterium]|nr:hypothetical protein [Parachlamydiaceae bacterium]
MNGSISESITVKVFQKVICSDWLFPSNCVKKKIKDLGSLRESFNNYKIEHPNNNLFERIKHPSYFGDKLIRPAMKAMRLVIRAAITPIIFGPVAIVGFFWNVRKFIHLIDLKRKHSIS